MTNDDAEAPVAETAARVPHDGNHLAAVVARLFASVGEQDGASFADALRVATGALDELGADPASVAALHSAAGRAHEANLRRAQRVGELTALHQIAVDLARVRDPDEALQAIVRAAQAVIPSADATYLLLSDPSDQTHFVKASVGLNTPEFMHMRVPDGFGMMARIYETQAPLWTQDYAASGSFVHDAALDSTLSGDDLRSVLGVPMISNGERQGVLYAANRIERSFAASEVSVLQQFAELASIAIQNSRLVSRLQRTAADIGDDMDAAERAAQLHADLIHLAVEGADFSEVMTAIREVLPGELTMLDRFDRVIASDGGAVEASSEVIAQVRVSRRDQRLVTEAMGERFRHVSTVTAGESSWGALILLADSDLSTHELRALERAARIVALLSLQQQSMLDAEERVRGELLNEIVQSRRAPSTATLARASRRGVDLRRNLAAISVVTEPDRYLSVRRAVADFAAEHGGIGGEQNGSIAALVTTDDPGMVADRLADVLTTRMQIDAVVCVSGAIAGDSGGLRDAYDEARRCAAMLYGLQVRGRGFATIELAPFSLLFTPGRERDLTTFLERTLLPLQSYDAEHSTDLVDTVSCYFRNSMNVAKTARELYVHANTVVKRLERVTRLLGADWQSDLPATRLRIALLLHSVVSKAPSER